MNGNLRIDRDILIAAGTGMVSIIGICLVLAFGLRPTPEPQPVVQRTATLFKYQLLATETYTPDPSQVTGLPESSFEEETTDPELFPTDDAGLFEDPVLFPTLTEEPFATDILVEELTEEPLATDEPIVDEEDVLVVGNYDDTDNRIIYTDASTDEIGWDSEIVYIDNVATTIHFSYLFGDTARFTFFGRQLVIGYLGSPDVDLGSATVVVDGNPHQLDQSRGDSWTSPQLPFGEHTVVITHQTGDQIYLDYIEVR